MDLPTGLIIYLIIRYPLRAVSIDKLVDHLGIRDLQDLLDFMHC